MLVKLEDAPWEPEFIGQAAGFLEVEIRARVGGILEKRIFEEGQFVKQGTQLFQIDPVPYRIELERSQGILAQAEANLERTRREYVRVAALFDEDAVSEKELDEAEMAFKAAAADLQELVRLRPSDTASFYRLGLILAALTYLTLFLGNLNAVLAGKPGE